MQILSKAWKVSVILLALAALGRSAETSAENALQSLVAAEKNFAQMSVEKNIRDAFLANLADDAIMFDPGPVNGKQLYQKL